MWTDKQKEAIDKRNSNVLVAASAGSGKTAVLVERVITRVIEDNIDINRLLIVTFTNASASELKERLLKRICEALDKDKSNAFLKRQIKNINIANIETIHSFCLKLIRSNFDILEIDPNIKVCDESYSRVLKLKAINEVLEKVYMDANSDDIKKEKLYKVLELFSSNDDNLIEYILKIYSYINSFSYPLDTLKENIEKYNVEDTNIDLTNTDFGKVIFDDVISSLDLLLDKGNQVLDKVRGVEEFKKIANVIDTDLSYIKSILNESITWDKLYEMLSKFSFLRMPSYKGTNEELKEEVTNFRNKILKKQIELLKKQVYEKSKNILLDNKRAYEYISYLYDIICKFDEKYAKLKRDSSVIDFSDIEHLALNLLVKRNKEGKLEITDIAKEKRKEFEEIYTDEYQDTSFVQEAILGAVASSNNRFMVGDVKQSIYKFRQAMPEIFNEKYNKYPLNDTNNSEFKDVKILLNKNFRSRKNVIESINEIFEKIMSSEVGNCNYLDIEKLEFGASKYLENKENNYKTEINVIDLKDDKIEDRKSEDEVDNYLADLKNFEIEAEMISNKIKELMLNFKTYDIKNEEFRPARYKDIVILLRSIKDKGEILENILKENGIPAFSDTSSSIFESDEVKLILSLLRIIDNPFQDIYMVSVMYSIIGKFSLDELINIRSVSKDESIYNSLYILRDMLEEKEKKSILDENTRTLLFKVQSFISFLERYLQIAKIYSVSQILLKLYKDTNIYNQYLLQKDTAKLKRANLDYLIDIAINYENNFDDNSISSYIKYVDNLKGKVDSSSSSAKILGENEDVVRIMTIHKSKGLEFPIVILCDTMTKYNIRDTSNTVIMDNELGIGINVVRDDLNITYPSVIKQAIKSKIIKDIKSEELRMLYVALTRAKEKLIIFATLNDYEKFLENQNVILNGTKIDYKIVEKNSDYFSNISLALKTLENKKLQELFDINVITKDDIKTKIKDKSENNISNITIKDEIEVIKNGNDDNMIEEKVSSILKILKNNLDFKYKYIDEINTESRISVSKLKQEENEVKNIDNEINNMDFKVPECIDNITKKTGTTYGTTMHTILMYLDYKEVQNFDDLKNFIQKLIDTKIILKENVTNEMINKINIFLNSKIGNKLRKSKEVYKEKEFILKDRTISKSDIQGIIDLYYINENGNIVLVDFKTDNLKVQDEFISRYKVQLDIYKAALEKLTNKSVEKVYIYSFKLGKEIEVKNE